MDAAIQKVNGKKVLGSVPEAENLIVTSDHRWFASGSDGLYQIDPDGVTPPQKIPIAFDAHSPPSTDKRSFFLGITQYRHFIYATCTPDPDNAASPRYIMLMDMTQSLASMAAIHQISDPDFWMISNWSMAGWSLRRQASSILSIPRPSITAPSTRLFISASRGRNSIAAMFGYRPRAR